VVYVVNVKRKATVKSHFKRCSDKLGFKSVFDTVTKEINKTSGHTYLQLDVDRGVTGRAVTVNIN